MYGVGGALQESLILHFTLLFSQNHTFGGVFCANFLATVGREIIDMLDWTHARLLHGGYEMEVGVRCSG